MNNFANIPADQPATNTQFWKVLGHLTTLAKQSNPDVAYPSLKRTMMGTLNKIYDYSKKPTVLKNGTEVKRTGKVLTHGTVQNMLKLTELPEDISGNITVDFSAQKPTVSKAKAKPKASAAKKPTVKKPTAKKTPVKSKEEPTVQPTNVAPSKMSAGDFKDHFEKITGRVFRLESKLEQTTAELAQTDDVVCLLDDKISLMESKLDILMAGLESNPEA